MNWNELAGNLILSIWFNELDNEIGFMSIKLKQVICLMAHNFHADIDFNPRSFCIYILSLILDDL